MKKLVKTKVINLTETHFLTLQKMKTYNIDVGKFIREAISEKIKREYKDLIPKPEKMRIPFILIILLSLTSCDIQKKATKSKNDIDFSESIKTETYRKGDTVSFLVPKYKDTTIYVTNRQGTTVRTIYDKKGSISNIDCYASTIKQLTGENRYLKDQSIVKNSEKSEGIDNTFMLYLVIGLVVIVLIKS